MFLIAMATMVTVRTELFGNFITRMEREGSLSSALKTFWEKSVSSVVNAKMKMNLWSLSKFMNKLFLVQV